MSMGQQTKMQVLSKRCFNNVTTTVSKGEFLSEDASFLAVGNPRQGIAPCSVELYEASLP